MGAFLWPALAYILGSISFGSLVAKNLCGVDPRAEGSGNTGATNIARLCGAKYGAIVLALDLAKGAVPVALALVFTQGAFVPSLTALAAVVGHVYSVFLGFKGGKAVATTIGVFLPLAPLQTMAAMAVCGLVIKASGFVSLGSLTLVTALPALLVVTAEWAYLPVALAIMALVFHRHRDNIQRLAKGEEKTWKKREE